MEDAEDALPPWPSEKMMVMPEGKSFAPFWPLDVAAEGRADGSQSKGGAEEASH